MDRCLSSCWLWLSSWVRSGQLRWSSKQKFQTIVDSTVISTTPQTVSFLSTSLLRLILQLELPLQLPTFPMDHFGGYSVIAAGGHTRAALRCLSKGSRASEVLTTAPQLPIILFTLACWAAIEHPTTTNQSTMSWRVHYDSRLASYLGS